MDPLIVLSVSLIGSEKNWATIISDLTFLYNSRVVNSTIKRKHTRPYDHILSSNKVDYSTAAAPFFPTHNVKVPFLCLVFLLER